MENKNQESAPTHPNQRLGSPSHESRSASSNEQAQKWSRPESPQHERHTSVQSPKRGKNANLPPPSFPQEIVVEILSNLPVKSLIRLRYVSKSWESLITDPFFIKKHLKRTRKDPTFSKQRVLMSTASAEPIQDSIRSFCLNAIYKDSIVNTTEIEYPSNEVCRSHRIVGSCNGLICIATRKDTVFLLNPALRVFKKLPDLGFKHRGPCNSVYGFGFDASVNDYKVVRVFCYRSTAVENGVCVYSLKTNCWRKIPDFPPGFPMKAGKHVDGSLNWAVVRRQGMDFFCYIVSLDLAEETYTEVLQPSYGDDAVHVRTLGVLDGCLCLTCNYGRSYADVWVMKEYGNSESWTKLFSIPFTLHPFRFEDFRTPLFVSETGEILMRLGENLVMYNPKENASRILGFPNDAISYIREVFVYEESLVSPIVGDRHR
ncbi:hypothetical protein like AT3G23880 [Hibiscus trionum]|uniref:F-box domain-containing protein n=1 Tax=Hibiscus trionum TaxID=183268 RepID=A0A9W7IJD3_HIBTR|nr:hypothetical protein like AT3G23880 [Hibiscus trionum]